MINLADINTRGKSQLDWALAEIDAMKQRLAMVPSTFVGEGASSSPLFQILGGNTITYLGKQGIARRTDAVAGSELPVGTGGVSGDTIIVPANPIPVGLPNGVGVALNVVTGIYSFVVLDSTTSAATPDLIRDDIIESIATLNLDKVSSGITYRYVCIRPVPGWW